MSQLSLGHYFLRSGLKPLDVWYKSDAFAEALVRMSQRYRFDGILVNLPGRDPNFEKNIETLEQGDGETIVRWKNGNYTVLPDDDNARYYLGDGTRFFPTFEEIDPDALYYIEPWDITGISYPYTWDFETEPRPFGDYFPPYHLDAIKRVKEKVGGSLSVHSEVFSPWSQFLELLNYENALMAILDDPGKVRACLERLTEGAIDLARRQAACGVDAILISSAFAGAGLISRAHYESGWPSTSAAKDCRIGLRVDWSTGWVGVPSLQAGACFRKMAASVVRFTWVPGVAALMTTRKRSLAAESGVVISRASSAVSATRLNGNLLESGHSDPTPSRATGVPGPGAAPTPDAD